MFLTYTSFVECKRNRAKIKCVKNCNFEKKLLIKQINQYKKKKIKFKKINFFGSGSSKKNNEVWTFSN